MKKLIITVRPNEWMMRGPNPHIPYTPDEIAEDAAQCREAGAAIMHVHARLPDGGKTNSPEPYPEITRKVRAKSDILVHTTLGNIHNAGPDAKRLAHVAEAKPAIDGVAGIAVVTRAAPDGYTLLMVSSSHAINTAMGLKLPYDPLQDLAPITQTASQQLILTVHPSVPAIGDAKRSAFMPDLPTVAESGVPEYQAVIWTGMLAPAKTPRAIIDRLNKEVVRIVRAPDLTDRLVQLGSDTVGSTPEQFDRFVRDEIVKWSAIAKKVGIKTENF